MAENHLGDIDLLFRVNLNGDAPAVVPHADFAFLPIYGDPYLIHVLVILFVVGSVDKDLIEDLVQARDEGDLTELHAVCSAIVNPHLLLRSLNRADVRIRTLENVLELRELLILLRNSFALFRFPILWFLHSESLVDHIAERFPLARLGNRIRFGLLGFGRSARQ